MEPNGGLMSLDIVAWCVVKPGISDALISDFLNKVCLWEPDDCAMIQGGKPCFLPNSFDNHAGYMLSSILRKHGKEEACYSDGIGAITFVNPNEYCEYPNATLHIPDTNGANKQHVHGSKFILILGTVVALISLALRIYTLCRR
ncbi:glucan endo-1,3-beta-D-glucosidase-like [Henckelia pumila]|uniref:glucan endo-1,3-beta-D-glucosidase-like n=1 Tax=Henckelia pumila TaxID=405737 RepID=UPI003C6E5F25